MNIGLILIGGSGERFGGDIPKQFVQINGKEAFIYTTEVFQNNDNIDEIAIVYPKGYLENIVELVNEYDLIKVKHYITGGKTRQESGYNAAKYFYDFYKDINPIILEHDGDRLLIDDTIIDNCIECTKKNGNAWPCMNSCDYIAEGTPDNIIGNLKTAVKRQTLRTHAPCCFYLKDLYDIYKYCEDNNINDMCIACDIALDMGIKVYPVPSTTKLGIKLVTKEDLEVITAIINERNRKNSD